ncbi:MAG: hypothetical protein IJ859_11090 [Synergistaceae bacterium]|nr:hypothetical protein [Synergistaceae bacterium]
MDENVNVCGQDIAVNADDERARTLPVYQKELTLEDMEEAEKIKAMPEYQELEQSCESYMGSSDEVQSGEIKKMPELLKKIPENLRSLYFEQLHDFEQICEKEVKLKKNILSSVFLFVVCLAVLFVLLHYLDSSNWLGRFILSSIIMLTLPEFILRHLLFLGNYTKEAEKPNENDSLPKKTSFMKKTAPFVLWYVMYILLRIVCWCAVIVISMFPSWGSFSWLGWKTPIALAVIVALICVIIWSFMFNLVHKIAKRAAVYVKDFENFTSQYEKYRNFKKSAEGAKE